MLQGNPEEVFNTSHSIVLSEEVAQKLFGQADPIGEIVAVKSRHWGETYAITGILRNLPKSSTLSSAFILLIACVNFMNLATARSVSRAKEIGIRKVVGAHRSQLIGQFLVESVVLASISSFLALGIVKIMLPFFCNFVGRDLDLISIGYYGIGGMFGIVFVTGLLSGIYPAFFLSGFLPTEALKGKLNRGFKNDVIRRGLIVFQFSISIVLIISALTIQRQLKYLNDKDLGFDKEQIVILPIFLRDREAQNEFGGPLTRKYDLVKQEFLAHPNVLKAAASNTYGPYRGQTANVRPEGFDPSEWRIPIMGVDEDFASVYGIDLIEGRNFSGSIKTDLTEAVILNEAGIRKLGWTSPIGKRFGWQRNEQVIGVVKDFHNETLHQSVGSVVLSMWRAKFIYLSLKVRTRNKFDVLLLTQLP